MAGKEKTIESIFTELEEGIRYFVKTKVVTDTEEQDCPKSFVTR